MPLFRYKAASASGELLEGEMEALNQQVVVKRLQGQGHIPIRAEPVAAPRAKSVASPRLYRSRRVSRRDIEMFTQELSILLHSGLSLSRALQMLADLGGDQPIGKLVAEIFSEVRGGASLSSAMEAQTGAFTRFYVNIVRAGEAGGALELALGRLAEFLQRSRELKESIVSSLIYPVILVMVALLSVSVILAVVVPRFSQMFEEAGQELPVATQVVVAAGSFLEQFWWVLVIAVVLLVLYFRQQYQRPASRERWDRRWLRLTLVGPLIRKIETERFSRTLGTLLESGVPLHNAVMIAKEVIGNQVIARGVGKVAEQIREGRGLAKPLAASEVFPALASQMLQVGEETGSLESILNRLADIYDREVRTTLQRLIALAEPVLILTLGVVIAGIILSILAAILKINELGF